MSNRTTAAASASQKSRLMEAWDKAEARREHTDETARLRAELRAWIRAFKFVTFALVAFAAVVAYMLITSGAFARADEVRDEAARAIEDLAAMRADLAPVVELSRGIARMMDGRGAVKFDRAAN